jgi:FkbM family methyltransferase
MPMSKTQRQMNEKEEHVVSIQTSLTENLKHEIMADENGNEVNIRSQSKGPFWKISPPVTHQENDTSLITANPLTCSQWTANVQSVAQELNRPSPSFSCQIEGCEYEHIREYVLAGDVVLEVGGRFGTSSCEIAKQVGAGGKLIVMEPSTDVFPFLKSNLEQFHCSTEAGTWAVNAALAEDAAKPLCMNHAEDGYGQATKHAETSDNAGCGPNQYAVSQLTPEQVLSEAGGGESLNPDVLIIDCEGCGAQYDALFSQFLKSSIRVVYLENDAAATSGVGQTSYENLIQSLESTFGFTKTNLGQCVHDGHTHLVFQRPI